MQNLAIIYGAVIDDVLSKVRADFIQDGEEHVVEELRALWEEKLLQTGVLDTPSQEEYQEPLREDPQVTQGFLAPGSSLRFQQASNVSHSISGHQDPPPTTYASGQQYLQQQQYLPQPFPSVHQGHTNQLSLSPQPNAPPNAYRMQQPVVLDQQGYGHGHPQVLQQSHSNTPDSRKRKAEALQVPYGVNVTGPPQNQERLLGPSHPQSQLSITSQGMPQTIPADAPGNTIPQQDGPADDPTPSSEAEGTAEGTAFGSLSDVELDEEDVVAPGAEMLPDYILGQFDLVRRTKNRWKCTFNHAVMHLNGQDVVVTSAQGKLTETEKCKPFGDHNGALQP